MFVSWAQIKAGRYYIPNLFLLVTSKINMIIEKIVPTGKYHRVNIEIINPKTNIQF